MADRRRVLIVIPALNEELSVADVIAGVRDQLPDADCLVVDDGSTDETALVSERAGAQILSLPFNLGVGAAMRAGFRFAVDHGYEIVVQVDADGQHHPGFIPALVAGLERADVVIGARFAGVGDYAARGPRRWAMRFLAWAVGRIARQPLTDVTSGFKANGPRAVRLFARTYPAEYLGDTVEALVIGARAGLIITQFPVEMLTRQAGAPSHRPVRATVYLIRAVIAFLLALLRPPVDLPAEGASA